MPMPMSKEWKPAKPTVELQQSRIRREPVADKTEGLKLHWRSREWEIGLAIAGMIVFALALNALWIGINAFIIE